MVGHGLRSVSRETLVSTVAGEAAERRPSQSEIQMNQMAGVVRAFAARRPERCRVIVNVERMTPRRQTELWLGATSPQVCSASQAAFAQSPRMGWGTRILRSPGHGSTVDAFPSILFVRTHEGGPVPRQSSMWTGKRTHAGDPLIGAPRAPRLRLRGWYTNTSSGRAFCAGCASSATNACFT